MRLAHILFHPQQIQSRCAGGFDTKVLIRYLATEYKLLQIVKSGCTLDIGQRFFQSNLLSFIDFTAD
ncbi:hypothetical protein [Nitrosomonas ureae]|uniref:hypothetical protein n=1 Tax=Nitrosomonas ureae TaxID=44577 RepID=UPI0015E2303C|nr:hypothetical protein [Nitrosomonas ureae]